MPKFNVAYDSNNSGGSWWLKDKDWKDLEEAGWHVHWAKDRSSDTIFYREIKKTGRWLGALATSACTDIDAKDSNEAKRIAQIKWEGVTGKNGDEEGCSCCGQPHNFYAHEGSCYLNKLGDKNVC